MVGSSVGRLHWPGSRRTLEGSASVFLSTLGSLLLLWFVLLGLRGEEDSGGEGWRKAARSLAWPVALTSLMEAFTTQVCTQNFTSFVVGVLSLSHSHTLTFGLSFGLIYSVVHPFVPIQRL